MSSYTITKSTNHNGPIISVASPYSAAFVTGARGIGGRWNRTTRTWDFGHRLEAEVKALCVAAYDNAPKVPTTTPTDRHLGNVGEKLTVLVTVERIRDFEPYRNGGAPSRFHVLRATTGEQLVWRSSSTRLDVGTVATITGTVKEHGLYRDIRQTIITRCKAATMPSLPAVEPSVSESPLATFDDEIAPVEDSGEYEAAPAPRARAYACRECGAQCDADGYCAAHPSAIVDTYLGGPVSVIDDAPIEF